MRSFCQQVKLLQAGAGCARVVFCDWASAVPPRARDAHLCHFGVAGRRADDGGGARLRVAKDVRKVIATLVWDAREEALFPHQFSSPDE